MHILHSLFTNAMGGTERHLAELANAQVAAGHRVSIMLRCNRRPYGCDDPFLHWLHPEIEVITLPNYWPFSRWPLWPIKRHLARLKPDIIHTHHGRDSRYLARAAVGKIPVVGTLHMPYRDKDCARHDGLICVSNWQMADIPADKQSHSIVVPNWVKNHPAPSDTKKQGLRQTLELGEDVRIFGAVGRLTEEKGVDDLIEAFIAAKLENVVLCVFGEGEMRPQLERLIAEHHMQDSIRLMGYVTDIHPWYHVFDMFVLPSRAETFGLVLLEAMAAGCPILTTKTKGARDVLGDNENVIWADVSSPLSLMQSLRLAAATPREQWEYPELKLHQLPDAVQAVLNFYKRFV